MIDQKKANNEKLIKMLEESLSKRVVKAKKQMERKAKLESLQRILGTKDADDPTISRKDRRRGAVIINPDLLQIVNEIQDEKCSTKEEPEVSV